MQESEGHGQNQRPDTRSLSLGEALRGAPHDPLAPPLWVGLGGVGEAAGACTSSVMVQTRSLPTPHATSALVRKRS